MIGYTFLKRFLLLLITFSFINNIHSQTVKSRPKLVVGIVVDQMRWDYLYRYSEKYSANGFKKLLDEGYSCEQTYINYFPSYTAPGHTAIYTGSVPAVHGIAANDWYERTENKVVYCTSDTSVQSVGGSKKAGQQSPHRLYTTTICDELRLATNFKSKTIGIALKDRGAILPAGQAANAAYWFDGITGNWISSSYYMKELPTWVQKFNAQKLPEKYVKENWKTLLDISQYHESTEDDKWYERPFPNEIKPVFEHKVAEIKNQPLAENIKSIPYGNTLTAEFAKAAIIGDTLGNRGTTDFLAVSFSPTDYIGHQFGINAIETQDVYIRLDQEIASLLEFLNEKIGKGEYLVFLSADHGGAHAVGFNKENRIPAGNVSEKEIFKIADSVLQQHFQKKNLVSAVINQQLYLDHNNFEKEKINIKEACDILIPVLSKIVGVDRVVAYEQLSETTLTPWFKECLSNQYKPLRTGDLQLLYHPAWMDDWAVKGTTHGSIFPYDTHIPLVFYGWGIKHGETVSKTYITDIAPTIAALLKIQMPNGAIGKPVKDLFK